MYQFYTRLEQQVTAKVVGQLSNLLYSLLPKTCSRGHMSCLMDHEKFSFTKPRMRKKKKKLNMATHAQKPEIRNQLRDHKSAK